MSNITDKIIRQVEYYFGDVNMNKDKFLQEEVKKDEGWVALETLIKFNRLKALSTDIDEILKSLKESTSGLLEINETDKKVRRSIQKPLPENAPEFEITLKKNTVYVKGFPQTMVLDELYSFFEKYGKVLQIFMRRFPATRQFKGSVFVTFDKNEDMLAFLELKELTYKDTPLIIESQEDYTKRKGDQFGEIQKKKEEKKNKQIEKENRAKENFKKGALLQIKGCNEECTRENLKELFDDIAKIAWVYYNRGEPEAVMRFAEENTAKSTLEKALEAKGGKLEVKGANLECKVLEDEEESEFFKEKVMPQIENKDRFSNKKKNNGGKYGKSKGKSNGRNGNKKRSNSDDDDNDNEENNSKKLKA